MNEAKFRNRRTGTHPTILTTTADLENIARKVDRLSPDRRDPERFHVDRSDIVAELRRLARTMEAAPAE